MVRRTCATPSGRGRRRRSRDAGVVVTLAGTLEPADDVTKLHTTAFTAFGSPNGGTLGRVVDGRVVLERPRGPRRTRRPRNGRAGSHLVTAGDRVGRRAARRSGRGRGRRHRRGGDRGGEHVAWLAGRGGAGDGRRRRGGAGVALPGGRGLDRLRVPRWRRDVGTRRRAPGRDLCAIKARVALALGLGAGLSSEALATLLADPAGRLTGHAPRHAGHRAHRDPRRATKGFGWVEAIGIRNGRIAFAGSEVFLETRADPFTQRIHLEPDQVAIPGLTDAHLHLAQAAIAQRQVDLTRCADARRGPGAPARRPRRRSRPTPGWRATAGTATDGAAGRPPTSSRRWRPAAEPRSGPTTITPCGPATRRSPRPGSRRRRSARRRRPPRAPTARPEGVLYEAATRLVTVHVPPPTAGRPGRGDRRGRPGAGVARASSPATTRAAWRPTRTSRTRSRPTRAWPRPAGCRCGSTRACATTRCAAAIEQGHRSGDDPRRRPATAARRSAGRSASPTARSGRGPPRSSPTSSRSPTGRSRPTGAAASG